MIVDSSALLAILFAEPDAPRFAAAIAAGMSEYSIMEHRPLTRARMPTFSSGRSLNTTFDDASDRRSMCAPRNDGSHTFTSGLSTWK